MWDSSRLRLVRYGYAVASVAIAIEVRMLLDPALGDGFHFATVYFAILLTAWYGGFGPALVAVVAGGIGCDYFLLRPRGSLSLLGAREQVGMVLYVCTGVGIATLGGAMAAARRRAEGAAREAAEKAEIVELSYDAVLVWEWGGVITIWNRGAERLYGIPRGDAVGRVSHELLKTTTAIGVEGFVNALGREGRWEGELEHTLANGSRITVETRMVLNRGAGRAYVIEANRDITLRRRAEDALRKAKEELEERVMARTAELERSRESTQRSEARMGGIVSSAMDAIISVDSAQRVVLFNAAAERMFGCGAEEAMGGALDRFIPARYRERHRQDVAGFGKAGVTSRSMHSLGELSGVRTNGEEFPIEAAISQVEVAGEKIYTVILRDITQRRGAERAGELLAAIVESSSDAIVGKDINGIVTSWNAGAERMFGYTAEEMVGRSIKQIIPEDRLGEEEITLERVRRGERMEHFQTVRRRKDGGLVDISLTVSPIKDGRGRIVGASKVARDISDWKRAVTALRESEERMHAVTENLAEGLIVSDLEGRLLHWNRAILEMLGYERIEGETLQRESFSETFAFATLEGCELAFEEWPLSRVLRGERLRDIEARVRRRDKEWERVFSFSGAIINDASGKPLAFLSINDITERKRAEEEIAKLNEELEDRVTERTAQLTVANKELEAFSYSVSHDLRAPLRAVDGFSQAVVEDYGGLLPEEGRRYLAMIREGAQQMGALIDDLLTFSRLSRAPLAKREVNTEILLRGVLEQLEPDMEGRNVEVRLGALPTCTGDGALPTCTGDGALLKQVWINLISNALKYTRKREAAVVEIGCERTEEGDVYYVKDNGTGFDMRYAHKLFGVFQRLHRAEEYGGTGVGLAIVQRVIHRHGGRVWGEGEVFCLRRNDLKD